MINPPIGSSSVLYTQAQVAQATLLAANADQPEAVKLLNLLSVNEEAFARVASQDGEQGLSPDDIRMLAAQTGSNQLEMSDIDLFVQSLQSGPTNPKVDFNLLAQLAQALQPASYGFNAGLGNSGGFNGLGGFGGLGSLNDLGGLGSGNNDLNSLVSRLGDLSSIPGLENSGSLNGLGGLGSLNGFGNNDLNSLVSRMSDLSSIPGLENSGGLNGLGGFGGLGSLNGLGGLGVFG